MYDPLVLPFIIYQAPLYIYLHLPEFLHTRSKLSAVSDRYHPLHSQGALRDVAWSWSDGVIKCRFRRGIYTPQSPGRFLLNDSYYLFVAHGPTNDGEPLDEFY